MSLTENDLEFRLFKKGCELLTSGMDIKNVLRWIKKTGCDELHLAFRLGVFYNRCSGKDFENVSDS